jgi:hypothetical protein
MSVDFSYLIVAAIAIHTVILVILTITVKGAKEDRTRILWKLLVLEVVLLPVAFVILYYLQPPISWLTTTADVVYAVVVAFVLGLEVPGFILLSRFDEGIVNALEELRNDLITLGYSFDHLGQLKTTIERSKSRLNSARIGGLVIDFVASCDRMNNLDRNFWGLVLSEVTTASRFFVERSKHPSPKLIDVLSLAGLSFLLAQFLKLFG